MKLYAYRCRQCGRRTYPARLVCDRCGGIFDFSLPFDLGAEIERSIGGPVNCYTLVVRGCCPACRDK